MDLDGTSSDFWELVELFYGAWSQFRKLFETYESQVLRYSSDRGVDRKELKLSAEEVSGLFDFRAMERLRDSTLEPLKVKAHKLFRTAESTDTFDRSISEIFHEVSILKEEHYTVKTYGAMENNEIQELILEEVHHFFPIRLNKIKLLFTRSNARFEALLLQNADNRVLVRSLYLFGDALLKQIYPGGLNELYGRMYPEGGAFDGNVHAGRSFFDSGFWELSREAFEKALVIGKTLVGEENGRLKEVEDYLRRIRVRKN